ncbi:hypothetical protein F53441_10632 [Fusarium austroafricanum]|uniref:Uncharacterized protein n=1 Tax=Fusarium austroafricanum TaxID=2364996 RepID=A0A8H4NUC7_9HYPO|nr:hypothetical protein F53441_10632 [Fusarium austroafricanum]
MDILSGVGGSCAPTARVNNTPRRDSSISLEEYAYKWCTSEPTRSSLVPPKHQTSEAQHDDGTEHAYPLPTPSLPSTPSTVAPIDVYLRSHESLQARLISLSAILDQSKQATEPESISASPETSSWEVVDNPITASQQVPAAPILKPAPGPKTIIEATDPDVEVVDKPVSSDSSMSDLLLSNASHADSDTVEEYEEVVATFFATSKRSRYAAAKAPGEKTCVYKTQRKRLRGKRKHEERMRSE